MDGHESIVSFLLASGADANLHGHEGHTPLSFAAVHGRVAIVKQLFLTKEDINTRDVYGNTSLSNAACNGYSPIVESLLEAGAETIEPEPDPCCDFLEAKYRVEGYARDALLRAWEKGYKDVVRAILNSAAERELENEYSMAFNLLHMEAMEYWKAWLETRQANATSNTQQMKEVKRRDQGEKICTSQRK